MQLTVNTIHVPMSAVERVVVVYSSWENMGAKSLMSVRKTERPVVLVSEGTPRSSATIVTARELAGVVWKKQWMTFTLSYKIIDQSLNLLLNYSYLKVYCNIQNQGISI